MSILGGGIDVSFSMLIIDRFDRLRQPLPTSHLRTRSSSRNPRLGCPNSSITQQDECRQGRLRGPHQPEITRRYCQSEGQEDGRCEGCILWWSCTLREEEDQMKCIILLFLSCDIAVKSFVSGPSPLVSNSQDTTKRECALQWTLKSLKSSSLADHQPALSRTPHLAAPRDSAQQSVLARL